MKHQSLGGVLLATLSLCSFSSGAAEQEKNWSVALTADGVWASTKIRDIRDEDTTMPSFAAAIEHQLPYLPNFRVRYTGLDSEKIKHDKTDLTFYWRPLRTDNLDFDVGFTLTDYANSFYFYDENSQGEFDDFIFSWFASMAIRVPSTDLYLVSEFDYGETDAIKTADVSAGLQYNLPFDAVDVALRGGYRVLDYTFYEFGDKAYGFVDGWYAGASIKF